MCVCVCVHVCVCPCVCVCCVCVVCAHVCVCVMCSGVKKEAFLGFFEYYQSTALRLAAKLDEQAMLVRQWSLEVYCNSSCEHVCVHVC